MVARNVLQITARPTFNILTAHRNLKQLGLGAALLALAGQALATPISVPADPPPIDDPVSTMPVDVLFDGSGDPVVGPDFITDTSSGVPLTLRGYQVEIDAQGNETVFGPAPTQRAGGRNGFNYVPGVGMGFVSTPAPGYDITQSDLPGGGLIIPGFDSFTGLNARAIEWMEIIFPSEVTLNYIDVDDSSNFDRSIWAAGLNGTPDYSMGLTSALQGSLVQNSRDDATDGFFRHVFDESFVGSTLLIGAAPDFDLGNIVARDRSSSFFITGLGFQINADTPPPPQVAVAEPPHR